MTLSRFTTYVGLALDNVNAQIGSAGIAAAATSMPVTNINDFSTVLTTTGASYSAIIIDGRYTHSKLF